MIFDVINKGIYVVFTEPIYTGIAVGTFFILTFYNILTARKVKGFFFLEFVFAVLSLLWPVSVVGASAFYISNCISYIKYNIRRYDKMKEIKYN